MDFILETANSALQELINSGSAPTGSVPVGEDWWDTPGPVPDGRDNSDLTRKWFPRDFIFGTATSAYQVEGAFAEDGKSISIWDDFTMRTPYRIDHGTNGVVACDMYHKFKDDIFRMKQMGFDSYRFSLSWARILPGGRPSAGVNRKGIDYYNDVINTVIANGMKPNVTIFHWDLPDCLEKEYGGFMHKNIKDDFRDFAEICFNEFGDRVKIWATLNEPLTYAVHGYVAGIFPPGKKLPGSEKPNKLWSYRSYVVPIEQYLTDNFPRGDLVSDTLHKLWDYIKRQIPQEESSTNPVSSKADPKDAYTCARNMLLAHAEAAKLYREKYKESQHGKIGIVLNTNWCEPLNEWSEDDKAAASRSMDFMLGWFLEPALYGKYPQSMIDYVSPKNLASFTEEESEMLKDSIDYLGLNYYTAQYAEYDSDEEGEGYGLDQKANLVNKRNGVDIGPESPGSSWLHMVPWGLYNMLKRIHDNYSPDLQEIYITENGCSDKYDYKLPAQESLEDNFRKKYFQDHLANVVKVMKDTGVNVKGYYAWSWCDNFEWNAGYSARFGLVYVDYANNQTRYPKDSCAWFAKFLRSKRLAPVPVPWLKTKLAGKRSHEDNMKNGTQKMQKTEEDDQ